MKKLIKKHFSLIGLIIALLAVMFFMVWVRAYYGSMQDYQKGESLLGDNQYIRAITYFDRSIHWYTPFNPYVQRSAERLWEIGNRAEQQGDVKLALIAFRTIRSGFYSARSFYQPGVNWINQCDHKIKILINKEKDKIETENDVKLVEKDYLKNRKFKDPSILWTLFLEIGLLGWIGTVIGFIIFSLKHIKTFNSFLRPFLGWGILFFVFFTLWIIGMINA